MKSWLVFAHVISQSEQQEFDRNFKKCSKNLDDNTSVYILKIYNKKLATIYYISKQSGIEIIFKSRQLDLTLNKWIKKLVTFIKKDSINRNTEIKALSYYGHGGSVVLGPWADPLLGISDFTNLVVKPLDIILVTMDSCYMGGMTSMYEMAHYCKFAAASPSWHPDLSISTLRNFGKLPKDDNDETWRNYTRSLTCEFQSTGKKPKYSCLVPIDLRNLINFVDKIKVLYLTKNSVLKLQDPDQYDFYLSLEDPVLKNEAEEILINKRCIDICPERINGISVRKLDKDDSWYKYYVKTKWAKVYKKLKIVSEVPVSSNKKKSSRKSVSKSDLERMC
jgi:hypothetical protein